MNRFLVAPIRSRDPLGTSSARRQEDLKAASSQSAPTHPIAAGRCHLEVPKELRGATAAESAEGYRTIRRIDALLTQSTTELPVWTLLNFLGPCCCLTEMSGRCQVGRQNCWLLFEFCASPRRRR